MRSEDIIAAVESFALPILDDMGLELVAVEYRQESGWKLRLFIDREDGGINVDDCASVSRQVSSYLEVEDIIKHHYSLEVSSPGLERPLKREEDFVRFSGRKARIKITEPIDGQYVFIGQLVALDRDRGIVTLDLEQGQVEIDMKAIVRARLCL